MYSIRRQVGNSHVGPEGRLTLTAAIDFMQDCSGFQLDREPRLQGYFQEHDITMFLVSRQVNVHEPVFYGETVSVTTTIYQMKNSYGFRNTNLYDEEGRVRISSYAGGAFIDLNQMKATSIPKEILETVLMEEKFSGMEYLPRKIRLPRDRKPEVLEPLTVSRRFIDRNRHVNNAKYVEMAEEYLPEGFRPATLRIEYRTAAKQGDRVIPHLYQPEDGVGIVSLQDARGDVFANVEFRRRSCAL